MGNEARRNADVNAEVRDALREQLRGRRAQREGDEAVAAQLDRVLADIAAARRDRDAEMSVELDQVRRELERGVFDAEELMVAVARLWTRVHVAGLGEGDPRMRAARRVVEDDFRVALEAFAAAVNAEEEGEPA